jgi:hypothetical protein
MGGFERASSVRVGIWGSSGEPVATNGWAAGDPAPANDNASTWARVAPANGNGVDAASIAASLGMGELLEAEDAGGGLEDAVRSHVGLEFDHDGGYRYRVTSNAGFEIVEAPGGQGVGYEITAGGEYADAWETLAEHVQDLGGAPSAPPAGGGGAPPADRPKRGGRPRGGAPWGSRPAPGRGGGPTRGAPAEEPEAPKPEAPDEEEPEAPGKGGGSGGLPYTVGGYPSSRPAGSKYPAFKGAPVAATIPGLPLEDGNEKLTAPIVLPGGTVLTSGWRTDEEQADLIVHYAGGLVDGDLAATYEVASSKVLIAWVGESPHRPGLAFDLSGAALSAIEDAVLDCKQAHPGDGIEDTILESSNNCVHVDVVG